MVARPTSDAKIYHFSSVRKREPHGAKWLLPSAFLDGFLGKDVGAAVMLTRRYHGNPMSCCNRIRRNVTKGISSVRSSTPLILDQNARM